MHSDSLIRHQFRCVRSGMSYPRMSTPSMSTPKMSMWQNVNGAKCQLPKINVCMTNCQCKPENAQCPCIPTFDIFWHVYCTCLHTCTYDIMGSDILGVDILPHWHFAILTFWRFGYKKTVPVASMLCYKFLYTYRFLYLGVAWVGFSQHQSI